MRVSRACVRGVIRIYMITVATHATRDVHTQAARTAMSDNGGDGGSCANDYFTIFVRGQQVDALMLMGTNRNNVRLLRPRSRVESWGFEKRDSRESRPLMHYSICVVRSCGMREIGSVVRVIAVTVTVVVVATPCTRLCP